MKTKTFKNYVILDRYGKKWFISGNYWNEGEEQGLTDIRLAPAQLPSHSIACETEATIPDEIPQSFISDLMWQLGLEAKEECRSIVE